MDVTDLLLHPVRLRIVQSVADGEPFTTSDLCDRLPDISRATLYRQVALLAEGDVLEVVEEQRVRGATERHYRLHAARTVFGPDVVEAMTMDDHRRGFSAVMASLLSEFDLYLDHPDAQPARDNVSYKQLSLWLSPRERAELIEQVRTILRRYADNPAASGREQHLLSTIMFPRRRA